MVRGRYVGSFLDIPHGTKLVSLAGPDKTSPLKLRSAVVSRARFRISGAYGSYRHDDGVVNCLWRPATRASPFMLGSALRRRRSASQP